LHRRIFVAIRRKDPDEARRRMAEHPEDARELFKRATALEAQSSLQSRIGELASNISGISGPAGLPGAFSSAEDVLRLCSKIT